MIVVVVVVVVVVVQRVSTQTNVYHIEGRYAIFPNFTNICFIILVYVDIYIYIFYYIYIFIYIYIYIYKCTPYIHPMGFRLNHFELDTHFKAHFTL